MLEHDFLHLIFFGKWAYVAKIFLASLGLAALNYFFKKILKETRKKSLSNSGDWKEKIDQVMHLPFFISLWIIGLTFGFNILKEHFGFVHLPYIETFRNSLLVACGSWMLLRWTNAMRHAMLEKSKTTKLSLGTIDILCRVCSFVVIVLSCLLILQIFGLNILPLLAFGGIGAAAIAFAAKEIIANFFGGIMLYATRPFSVGDNIMIPSQNNLTGTVEEIGWYTTHIRDESKQPVYLPNSVFSSAVVINMSHMTHRPINETICLPIEEMKDLPTRLELIRNEITNHPRIDRHLPFSVVLEEFGSYSCTILLDGYTLATRYEDYLSVKQEILLIAHRILKSEAVERNEHNLLRELIDHLH